LCVVERKKPAHPSPMGDGRSAGSATAVWRGNAPFLTNRRYHTTPMRRPSRIPAARLGGRAPGASMLQPTWSRISLSVTTPGAAVFFNFFSPAKGGYCGQFRLGFGFVGIKKPDRSLSAFARMWAVVAVYGNSLRRSALPHLESAHLFRPPITIRKSLDFSIFDDTLPPGNDGESSQ
jgi:hypothetical protein